MATNKTTWVSHNPGNSHFCNECSNQANGDGELGKWQGFLDSSPDAHACAANVRGIFRTALSAVQNGSSSSRSANIGRSLCSSFKLKTTLSPHQTPPKKKQNESLVQ